MKLKILVCLSLITLVALFAPAAHGQTFSVIHTLTGPKYGRDPYAGVSSKADALYVRLQQGRWWQWTYQMTIGIRLDHNPCLNLFQWWLWSRRQGRLRPGWPSLRHDPNGW